ncbi:DUF6671 family protein [Flavobacterium lacus]|uniref:DUF6671 domain-containing protein n=1 Tax=Flavobacterium lacus TaxID=1353778 RepID=A0A328WKG3_9FLAO|nr:DUF6671 family protein [Flavobacterium lacus]RAR46680.1 hypothetical protein B0I10_11684 [Flavobacterium lacus]
MKFFEGRKLIVATKHHKEKVILPLVEEYLGVDVFVPSDFDTDKFGTFSGEVERTGNALEAIRKKCYEAMEQYGYDLVVASEGSFGPHPSLFFAQADDELLMLIDKKNELEIIARELSLETNFNAEKITSQEQLLEFAQKSDFPSHGLILKDAKENSTIIHKDILDWENLQAVYESIKKETSEVWVETDMRAYRNPTRMKVIEKATQKLIKKINTACPNCQAPGFDVNKVIKGLPCKWCKSPTESTFAWQFNCKKCNYTSLQKYPNDKQYESPEFCNYCNP